MHKLLYLLLLSFPGVTKEDRKVYSGSKTVLMAYTIMACKHKHVLYTLNTSVICDTYIHACMHPCMYVSQITLVFSAYSTCLCLHAIIVYAIKSCMHACMNVILPFLVRFRERRPEIMIPKAKKIRITVKR